MKVNCVGHGCLARFDFNPAESRPYEMLRCSECKTVYYVNIGAELLPITDMPVSLMTVVDQKNGVELGVDPWL